MTDDKCERSLSIKTNLLTTANSVSKIRRAITPQNFRNAIKGNFSIRAAFDSIYTIFGTKIYIHHLFSLE